MKNSTGFILLSVFFFLTIIIGSVYSHYTPHWAVHIKGGPHVAQKVAADHGFIFLDEVSVFVFLKINCFSNHLYIYFIN